MGKNPGFFFFPGDWRRDTQVQMASFETRGVWWEILCCMFDSPERGILEGKPEELIRLIGCDLDTFNKSLEELKRLKIADVTFGHSIVTIINRRMDNERKVTENNMKRKRKERANTDSHKKVTTPSSNTSKDTKDSIKEKGKKKAPAPTKIKCLDFVFLSEKEIAKLREDYGDNYVNQYIQKLNDYIGSTGRKYKSHYFTIKSWLRKDSVYR